MMDTITLLAIIGDSNTQAQTKRKVNVCSCTVSQLFTCAQESISGTDISGTLTIPEYQRPYVWGKKEIGKLVADLDEYFVAADKKSPYFYLGSIILHQDGERLNIIDGQQRLTTLALINGVLGNTVPAIKYQSPTSIVNIQECLKFLRSQDITKRIQSVGLSNINVTLVVTDSEDEAYTFFETQNTGGIRLSGIDIIKAHHLRVITNLGERQNRYAETWEQSQQLSEVANLLLKARRWNVLDWRLVPDSNDQAGIKQIVIEEYSERTLANSKKIGYRHVAMTNDYSLTDMCSLLLSVRQPLSDGENFIDYLSLYCDVYRRLFNAQNDHEIGASYYDFYKTIIERVDCTAFVKEFFQVAMICYCSRYGFQKVPEAAFWIFRYSYAPRLINQKIVREDSVPAFIRSKNAHLFDHILHCHSHDELMGRLKSFTFEINPENLVGNTAKRRFVDRVSTYFGFDSKVDTKTEFDRYLKNKIEERKI